MRTELITEPEYHRRRAEMEMERALQAMRPEVALRHLELAKIHRERRDAMVLATRVANRGSPPPVSRTDKEC